MFAKKSAIGIAALLTVALLVYLRDLIAQQESNAITERHRVPATAAKSHVLSISECSSASESGQKGHDKQVSLSKPAAGSKPWLLPFCHGRTRGGLHKGDQLRTEWTDEPTVPPCEWLSPLPTCYDARERPVVDPALLAALAPLAGLAIHFVGDSTMREFRQDLGQCLNATKHGWGGPPLDYLLTLPQAPAAGPLRLRHENNGFVRTLLGANMLSLPCASHAWEKGGMKDRDAEANSIPLRRALTSRGAFATYVGDALVFGGGLWNLGRDNAWNTQDNLGHPKFNSSQEVVDDLVAEVEEVAGFIRNNVSEPWRSELVSRLWWKEVSAVEYLPYTNHHARSHESIKRANREAEAIWAPLGVRMLRVYRYSAWLDDAKNNISQPNVLLTRDGTHLHSSLHTPMFRELFSSLLETPPTSLRAYIPTDATCAVPG